jgi:hypothetical protein
MATGAGPLRYDRIGFGVPHKDAVYRVPRCHLDHSEFSHSLEKKRSAL